MSTHASPRRVGASNADQQLLWHDSVLDALGSAVQAAGGMKRVASEVWPSLGPDIGAARLRSCLNPDHAQKLCPLELVTIARIAREHGDHSVMNYLCGALGYAPPVPVSPEDRRAQLHTQFIEAVEALERIRRDLAR